MRLITGQSCGAVIRRSHVRMPGVRVTQGRNGGKNVLIEYLCYILYKPKDAKHKILYDKMKKTAKI